MTDLLADRMGGVEAATDQAALRFERIARLVERSPNRTFADDNVRTSARRLARLLYLRLDGEMPDDDQLGPSVRVTLRLALADGR